MSQGDAVQPDPCSYSLVEIVRKLVHNGPATLSNDEIRTLCAQVFHPAIRRYWEWIRNVHGYGRGGRRAELDLNPRGAAHETDDAATDSVPPPPDEPLENALESAATDDDDERNPAEEPVGSDDALWNESGVLHDATSELWQRFSRPSAGEAPKDDGDDEELEEPSEPGAHAVAGNTVWEKALGTAMQQQTAEAREKTLLMYLRCCAKNAVAEWCGSKTSVHGQINRVLRVALRNGGFATRAKRGGGGPTLVCLDDTLIDAPERVPDIETLCRSLRFPRIARGSAKLMIPIPTPMQVHAVLSQIFAQNPAPIPLDALREVLVHGWNLHEPVATELPDGAPRSETEPAGQRAERSLQRGPGEFSNYTPEHVPQEDTAMVADMLVRAVAETDGCPLDPPPATPGAGKLGRLFIEFVLWMNERARDTAYGRYGIERYAEHAGVGKSVEYSRLNDVLIPLIREVLLKHDIQADDTSDAFCLLRERFRHRKPEFIEYVPLS